MLVGMSERVAAGCSSGGGCKGTHGKEGAASALHALQVRGA